MQPSSIVLTSDEATQLLRAAHAEEARCQGVKSRSEKQLEDAITQLEQAEKQLFDAQLSLGHLRYILKKSNFQFAEPGMQDRVRHMVEVNNCKSLILLSSMYLILHSSRYSLHHLAW